MTVWKISEKEMKEVDELKKKKYRKAEAGRKTKEPWKNIIKTLSWEGQR